MILEIACFNLESAKIAQSAGANRIELCEDYPSGGVTPSYELIKAARREIKLPLHVIIRPCAGGFRYSQEELLKMQEDILFCKQQGVDGIVLGVLTSTKEIDTERCKELVSLARPMSLTFHRAIDDCPDLKLACKTLIGLGIDRVLTSGGKGQAQDNLESLKQLQAEFGKQLVIMPGGGVRSSNILKLKESGCPEFHSAAITGETIIPDAKEIKKLSSLLKPGA